MKLGYACINLTLGSKTRTCRLETAKSRGIAYVYQLIDENLDQVLRNLEFNVKHGIPAYRISSEIFPHIANPLFQQYTLTPSHRAKLRQIGEYALQHKLYISFHCSAYVHLGSTKPHVVDNSIREMNSIYGTFIKYSQFPTIIIIHPDGCGGVDEAIGRFAANFKRLDKLVRDNLCVENTECINLFHTMRLAKLLKLPLVYDYFHAQVNSDDAPITTERELKTIKSTWQYRHERIRKLGSKYAYLLIYKFHISDQGEGRPGAHGDYVQSIPPILQRSNHVIMVEAKCKELAVLKLKCH